jgi:hypothetical protein
LRERCWIAERDGADGPENIGSVFLVAHPTRLGVPSCDCLLVNLQRAGSGWGRRSSRLARTLPSRQATTQSHCGRTAFWLLREGSTRKRDIGSWTPRTTTRLGKDLVSETWELSLVNPLEG